MVKLTQEHVTAYRNETYRIGPERRVRTKEEAIAFVQERGFIHFWPIKDVTLPSLWVAVAGDRPVPNEHDDPGHVTWGWKDELLGARRWYYAKVLRRKATMIALDVAPFFYALSENYGDPAEDYLLQYEEGRMTWEGKAIYETLLHEGPLDAVSLRQLAHLSSHESDSRFNRGLEMLQADFKVLPIGVAEVGAWKYAFVYDLVHRFYPDLPEQARPVRQAEARHQLAGLYLRSVGMASARNLMALFRWTEPEAEASLATLVRDGLAVGEVRVEDQPGDYVALAALVE